jgi:membrane protease YdiL (CAAX protease family)
VTFPAAPRRAGPATALGLVLALAVPFLSVAFAEQALGGALPPVARLLAGVAMHWADAFAILAIVFLLERRGAASIGLRPLRARTLVLGLAAAVVMFLAVAPIQYLNHALGLQGDPALVRWLMSQPFWLRATLVVTAGVFEEIAFRGYALERLAELTGRRWLAALVTWGAFTLCHGPSFGYAHLLPVAFVGALVTALWLWKRDLVLNIVAHAAFDGIGLLLIPALMALAPHA